MVVLCQSRGISHWGLRGDYEQGELSESAIECGPCVEHDKDIGNIVEQLRAAGEQIDDADLAMVSPLAHRHVIPNGTYFSIRQFTIPMIETLAQVMVG